MYVCTHECGDYLIIIIYVCYIKESFQECPLIMCTAQLICDLSWDTGVSKRSQLTHCIHPEWYTVNMEMPLL